MDNLELWSLLLYYVPQLVSVHSGATPKAKPPIDTTTQLCEPPIDTTHECDWVEHITKIL